MVDVALIHRKLLLLEEKKKLILSFKIKKYSEFIKGPFEKAIEKILQEMIEVCLDIGKHLISDQGWEMASEGREVFQRLHDHKVLNKKITEIMKKMVGFRNLIVHLYEKIDTETVFVVYTKHLKDFDVFSKQIHLYLKKGNKK